MTTQSPASVAATTPDTRPASDSLWSRDFVMVCVGQFFGFMAQGLANPIFPLYMVSQGMTESFVGYSLAAFNVVSFLVRPFFGNLVDTGRPRTALAVAGGFLGVGPLGYMIVNPILVFLVRGVNGIGWAGLNTSGSAWVAYLAPQSRRAEALGYYTMAQRVGSFAAPAVGLWLAKNVGFFPAFAASAACGVLVLVTSLLARSGAATAVAPPAGADGESPKLSLLRRLVEPGAFTGATLLVLNTIPGVVVQAYMPLYFQHIGLGGIEWYFLALGATGVFSRGLVGRWADRIGRTRAIGAGFAIQFAGLFTFVLTQQLLLLTLGGVVWIFGSALTHPSLYALAIDKAPAHRRGKAMATYTMAFQVGGGIGAVTGGLVLEYLGYEALHLAMAGVALAGTAIVLAGIRSWTRPRTPTAG